MPWVAIACLVFGVVGEAQQSSNTLGWSVFDPAVHDFGKNPVKVETSVTFTSALPECRCGSTGGDDLGPQLNQPMRQIYNACFVGDGQKGPVGLNAISIFLLCPCHCEERSDEAISRHRVLEIASSAFSLLAMTVSY